MSADESPLISSIPDADAVRNRLAQIANERALLMDLLRLAKRRQEARERARLQERAEEAAHA
jgi:hypothetical protein